MANRFSSTSSAGPSQRQLRAGELIRHALAEILMRGEVHEDGLPGAAMTITEVKASPDLRNATVYFSVLGKDDVADDEAALNAAAGKIRTALGRKITMKFTPQLVFRADGSFEEAARIDALLKGRAG